MCRLRVRRLLLLSRLVSSSQPPPHTPLPMQYLCPQGFGLSLPFVESHFQLLVMYHACGLRSIVFCPRGSKTAFPRLSVPPEERCGHGKPLRTFFCKSVYVLFFEEVYIYTKNEFKNNILTWKCFLDVVWVLWRGSADQLKLFFNHLNKCSKFLKFTMDFDSNCILFP